jgi:cytochrome c oxidase subunit 2
MVSERDLDLGIIRLLETDNRPILPYLVQRRIIITRLDVLHSWTVPSLGVKVDANPGRVNQIRFYAYQPGIYFGQCSEICGANHRFMPISLEIFLAKSY